LIAPYVNKVIFVDNLFLENLGQISRMDLDYFSNPELDTKVVSLPLPPSEIEEVTSSIDPSAIRPGSIVVRPGYTDQFVPVDSFSEDLVHRKFGLFVRLCIALGAKKVSITSIEDVSLGASDDVSTSVELGGSAPLGKAKTEFKSKQSSLSDDFRKSIMKLTTEARGGEPDLEAAETLMSKYGLKKDSLFTDILDMCKVVNNRLSRHEVSLDFSTDVKKVFDSSIQAKIQIMSQLYQGKADFERVRASVEKTSTATKLSVVVEF
jgi:hypothetical protein